MSKTKENVFFWLMVIVLIIGCLMSKSRSDRINIKQIEKWAAERHYEVYDIQECFFDRGPFWIKNDNQQIYCAKVNVDGQERTSYFRISVWWSGFDQAWQD